MLRVVIPAAEIWIESTQRFIDYKEQVLQLEHSLVSLSKWEAKWRKPFFGNTQMTDEETLDYIRCMTITQNVSPDVYSRIPDSVIDEVNAYIEAPMTATFFAEDPLNPGRKGGNPDIITAEIIYYWMIIHNIPPEYRKWHLNSLLALIRVCAEKNAPPEKVSEQEIAARQAAVNRARRKQAKSKG